VHTVYFNLIKINLVVAPVVSWSLFSLARTTLYNGRAYLASNLAMIYDDIVRVSSLVLVYKYISIEISIRVIIVEWC